MSIPQVDEWANSPVSYGPPLLQRTNAAMGNLTLAANLWTGFASTLFVYYVQTGGANKGVTLVFQWFDPVSGLKVSEDGITVAAQLPAQVLMPVGGNYLTVTMQVTGGIAGQTFNLLVIPVTGPMLWTPRPTYDAGLIEVPNQVVAAGGTLQVGANYIGRGWHQWLVSTAATNWISEIRSLTRDSVDNQIEVAYDGTKEGVRSTQRVWIPSSQVYFIFFNNDAAPKNVLSFIRPTG